MKIALAQLNYHIGNFEHNVAAVKKAIQKGKAEHADIVVFAELAVCGYPPRDFLEFTDFLNKCGKAVDEIAKECTGIAAVIGAPRINPDREGKRLFNSAFFLCDGKIQSVTGKTLLPTYDVFDEYRYFEPNKDFHVVSFKGKRIAITVCEDLWYTDDNTLYTVCPMDNLAVQKPDVIINIAASPFSYAHAAERKKIFAQNTRKYGLPLFYVNHVGAQTELIFDGGSMVVNQYGNIADELKYFEEDFKVFDLQNLHGNSRKAEPEKENSRIAKIHNALILGISDYFRKMGFHKAIVGLSGGIDSALTAVLAERALGNENVRGVLMPSGFSSAHSVKDAEQLAENLKIHYDIISIETIFSSFKNMLAPLFGNLPFNITEENIQARIRGTLLMGLSNKFGYILLNTSNKSETAVGYGTLYGDMCGGLSVLGDVYKTAIYEIAGYINREKEIIPEHTITKPPSAELKPNQKDSDSLPEYNLLDKILYQYIELRKGPSEIINIGFDGDTVNKILKMVNVNEYKRHQTPPILRISGKSFGMGRRMPIVAKYLL